MLLVLDAKFAVPLNDLALTMITLVVRGDGVAKDVSEAFFALLAMLRWVMCEMIQLGCTPLLNIWKSMSRAAGLCRRCGGPRRGRAARVSAPIAQCHLCGDDICDRHAVWDSDYYICTKCARALGKKKD